MAAFPYQAKNKITLVYPDLFEIRRYQFAKGLWTIKMMK